MTFSNETLEVLEELGFKPMEGNGIEEGSLVYRVFVPGNYYEMFTITVVTPDEHIYRTRIGNYGDGTPVGHEVYKEGPHLFYSSYGQELLSRRRDWKLQLSS